MFSHLGGCIDGHIELCAGRHILDGLRELNDTVFSTRMLNFFITPTHTLTQAHACILEYTNTGYENIYKQKHKLRKNLAKHTQTNHTTHANKRLYPITNIAPPIKTKHIYSQLLKTHMYVSLKHMNKLKKTHTHNIPHQ